jgi:hypothetical protein
MRSIILLTFLVLPFLSWSQLKPNTLDTTETHGGLIKFSAVPFLYAALFRQDYLWLGLHYERRLGVTHRTFQLTVDYTKYTAYQTLNGTVNFSIANNIEVWIVPQIRHYFRRHPYTGYFLGVFPTYLYRDAPADTRRGSYFGLGIGGGNQFKLTKRLRMELAARLSLQGGNTTLTDANGQPVSQHDLFPWLAVELNIGWLTKNIK